jgi:hypothetical protein
MDTIRWVFRVFIVLLFVSFSHASIQLAPSPAPATQAGSGDRERGKIVVSIPASAEFRS